jgi:hypothetical protein
MTDTRLLTAIIEVLEAKKNKGYDLSGLIKDFKMMLHEQELDPERNPKTQRPKKSYWN